MKISHLLMKKLKAQLTDKGFAILEGVFLEEQTEEIVRLIHQVETSRPAFRKTADLFAIRQFFKEMPEVKPLIFTEPLNTLLDQLFGQDYFVVKSIYFDKPPNSNWFVSWHQDLTISVNEKFEMQHFRNWTVKQGQFAVQPPLHILENIVTLRIHLDNTDETNGALKVIPGTHLQGICRVEEWRSEEICPVKNGGIMFMRPLLYHASGKSTTGQHRRVIHIELSNQELPTPLIWAERMERK